MSVAATDLSAIRGRLGGDLFDGGSRLLCPGPDHGKRDRSLSVWLNPQGRVLVHSFAGDSFSDCAAHLGLDWERVGRVDRRALDEMRRWREAEAERRRSAAAAFCERVWGESLPIGATVAEAYLASRGVAPGDDLRFHPRAPYSYTGAGGAPAMVALVRGAGGVPKGLHVTHLRPDATKARRTTFGPVAGAAVRLAPGDRELAVAEGVETALSFAELHGVPTWAALNAPSLAAFSPPPGVRRLYVGADNDDSGAGLAAAERLAEQVCTRCEVIIRAAPRGQDWNDVLRGVGK